MAASMRASGFLLATASQVFVLGVEAWSGTVHATHFWDCNGAACDSATLQPWDQTKFRYAPQYAPQDPVHHGGAVYGEKMWLTGAASDALSQIMGPDDTACCGRMSDNAAPKKGCGRCLLVKNLAAIESSWTAVVMKKNRCPPHSNNCGDGKKNFDIAAPGFDNLQYSTANICGQSGTYFASKADSGHCGEWYKMPGSVKSTQLCDCSGMKSATAAQRMLKRGCELFRQWGWKTGDPILKFKPVDCPEGFRQWIKKAYGKSGVKMATIKDPATTTPAPKTPAPKTHSPKTPVPKTQPPKTPAPKTHSPKTPVPKTPAPKTHSPKTPVPKTPVPKTQPPKTPAPKTHSPKTPVPKTPVPKTQPPKSPAPTTQSPKTQMPKMPRPKKPSNTTSTSTNRPNATTPVPMTPPANASLGGRGGAEQETSGCGWLSVSVSTAVTLITFCLL